MYTVMFGYTLYFNEQNDNEDLDSSSNQPDARELSTAELSRSLSQTTRNIGNIHDDAQCNMPVDYIKP